MISKKSSQNSIENTRNYVSGDSTPSSSGHKFGSNETENYSKNKISNSQNKTEKNTRNYSNE